MTISRLSNCINPWFLPKILLLSNYFIDYSFFEGKSSDYIFSRNVKKSCHGDLKLHTGKGWQILQGKNFEELLLVEQMHI